MTTRILWRVSAAALLAAFGFAAQLPAMAQTHRAVGRVTGVADGDTAYVVLDGASTRVRLAQIDAPEKAQPYGRRAEQSLRELVGKQEVSITWQKIDKWGRPVVLMAANGIDVNAEQVRRGYAWVDRLDASALRLLQLEAAAQRARLGLWADPHPIEPWKWRRSHEKDGSEKASKWGPFAAP